MSDRERRSFLSASGIGVLGLLAPRAASAQPNAEEAANVRLVTDFCAAWSARDLQKVFPFLAEDSVYRMSETTPPATGHEGVRQRLGSWMESSQTIEFRILETFARGPIVVNHRIDRFVSTTRPLTWEGIGVFFVSNKKIKEWSDYTIRVDRA